ncbi:MAG: hypothetical protein K2N61_00710 [Lachnospiraceae bacterium]|nr:hypothetical protein [Lachnospiraceae bacterium]
MKKTFLPCILTALFFLMLLHSSETMTGALNGLNLWLFTVVPSLLPYMIISAFLTENGSFRFLCRFLSPVTKHVFGLSEECGYVILLGFLCGYPIGSKLSADLVKKNEISVREGQILISFCNNVSPAFMITFLIGGIIGIPAFSSVLLAAMLGVPLFLGIIFSRVSLYLDQKKTTKNKTAKTAAVMQSSAHIALKRQPVPIRNNSFDSCITSSFENCFRLGGYIILFSILSEFIRNVLIAYPFLQNRICAILEITSGLNIYAGNSCPPYILLTECPAFTAFGGMCCLMQTHSMIRGSGLSLRLYFFAKLLTGVVTFFVCMILFYFLL